MSAHGNNDCKIEKFLDLLLVASRELIHVDFKKELFKVKGAIAAEDCIEKIAGYQSALRHIMGMYNAPMKYSAPFDSIHSPNVTSSSYLIYGIDYDEKRECVFNACPIDATEDGFYRGFLDENILLQQIAHRFTVNVICHYSEISIDDADITSLKYKGLKWLKAGKYGILEILHNVSAGPVFAREVTDNKKGRNEKNQIAGKLFIRRQASTQQYDKWEKTKIVQECYKTFNPNYQNYLHDLDELKSKINPKKSFQVLVTSPISNLDLCNDADSDTRRLFETVSKVVWNIVFDSDERTCEKGGFCEMFSDNLILPIKQWTNNDVVVPDHSSKSTTYVEVASKQTCLYLLTHGDSTVDVKPSTPFPITRFQALSLSVFNQTQLPVALVVYVLLWDFAVIKDISKICAALKAAWNESRNQDEESCYSPKFVFLSWHDGFLKMLKVYQTDEDYSDSIRVSAPIEQLISFFETLHQIRLSADSIKLPGSSISVTIPAKDFKTMNKFFTLYHESCGSDVWSNLKSDQLKRNYHDEVSAKYLKGFHLEAEAMFIHENGFHVFIERKIMQDVEKRLRQKLNKLQRDEKDDSFKNGEIVQLIHEPSAGGTTVGRVVLWKLRKMFPVLLLQTLDEKDYNDVIGWLEVLYKICQRPLCILIDTSVITSARLSDVETFASIFQSPRDNEIICVVLFVQQLQKIDEEKVRIGQFSLKNSLLDDEKLQLDKMMDKAANWLKSTSSKTFGLYGLCQFGKQYGRIEDKLHSLKNSGFNTDKLVLLLSAMTFSYSKQLLPIYFVAKITKQKPEECFNNVENILESFVAAKDFLLYEESAILDNQRNGIRPVTTYVAEKILNLVFGDRRGDTMIMFLDKLFSLLEESNICVQAVSFLSKPLFIQRRITFEPAREVHKKETFSRFVSDLEYYIGKDYTKKQLQKIVDHIGFQLTEEGPHVRAMFARYLAYRLKKIDEALNEMKLALICKNKPFRLSKSCDGVLLTTAANFLAMKVDEISSAMKVDEISKDQFLEDVHRAKSMVEDGITVLHRAQEKECNCYCFVTEARILCSYMNLYFKACHQSPSEFTQCLDTTDDEELKSAPERAMKKLSDLEHLLQVKYMEGFEANTDEVIMRIKMQILRMKIDLTHITLEVFAEMCNDDVYLVRGLTDYLLDQKRCRFRNQDNVQQDRQATVADLEPQLLSMIIDLYTKHIYDSSLIRENYRCAILAMIYIYKPGAIGPRMRSGNIQMARQFAEMWSKNYKDDNRPWYYLALFDLIESFSLESGTNYAKDKRKAMLADMRAKFQKSRDSVTSKRSDKGKDQYLRQHRYEMSFVVGNSTSCDLGMLIPKDHKYYVDDLLNACQLRIFTGKAKSIGSGKELYCDKLGTEVRVPYDIYKSCRLQRNERRQYWFCIQTRPSGLFVERLFTENPENAPVNSGSATSLHNQPVDEQDASSNRNDTKCRSRDELVGYSRGRGNEYSWNNFRPSSEVGRQSTSQGSIRSRRTFGCGRRQI